MNAESYIKDTMLSVVTQTTLQQKQGSLSYIIQDGQSTDNTLRIAREIKDQFAHLTNIKIEIISEPDKGMYDALGKALSSLEDGDIYSYLNAGDLYSPHAFEIVAEIFMQKRARFVTGINTWYNEKGHITRTKLPFGYNRRLATKGFYGTLLPYIQQESTFWSGALNRKLDIDALKNYKLAGDYYLWKTFSMHEKLFVVSAWLAGFRIHEGQLSATQSEAYNAELTAISEERNLFDYIHALWDRILWELPESLKLKYSKSIYSYDHQSQAYKPNV